MATIAQTQHSYRFHAASRVAASLFGGWVFVWGFVTLAITIGVSAGMPYAQARTLVFLLAFLIFLAAFLWAFAASSIARVWSVLLGMGAVMTSVAWLLTRTLH